MNEPVSAREALLIEAIGEADNLMQALDTLTPALRNGCHELSEALAALRKELAAFEARITAITDQAKKQMVQHMAVHADDAVRRLAARNGQLMADAARIAIGAELGATLQRWQAVMQPLIERAARPWESWLGYAATLSTGTLLGWLLAVATGHA